MRKEKVLIIVESPKKTKSIQNYLPKDKEFIILASRGHVVDLSKRYKYNLGININKDYEPHFIINNDKLDILQSIIDSATLVDKVLLCTDPDREGEAIAYHIANRIKQAGKPIKRVEFREITKKGVQEGIANERDIDMRLVNAAISRRVLDRVVGYLGSPFVIKRLGKGVSAGRVQSVALRLVTEREKEIENFKPVEYWAIKANLSKFAEGQFVANYHQKADIPNEEEALAIKKELESASYKIVKIEAKPKKRNPYPPLDTARLQMAASSRFKLSSGRTMDAAQKLYEDGKITYMRTDSMRISEEAIAMVRDWIKTNYPNCLPDKANFYKNSDSAQDAHEAIRPTDVSVLPSKRPASDEEKVYRVIWDSFVTCQMNPAIYDTTSVTIKTDGNRELRANGRILRELGWLTIAGIDKGDDDSTDAKLPSLIENDILTLVPPGVIADQKFTEPPRRYKEASLVEELKKRKIGRPSTYATIMNTICEARNFVTKKNEVLFPTDVGRDLTDLLCKYFTFMNYDYTANLEDMLEGKVSSGEMTYVDLMNEFFPKFKEEVDKAYKESENYTEYTCGKCGAEMLLKKSSLGNFLGCSNYPNCKSILPCEVVDGKIVIIKKELPKAENAECPKCGGPMVVRVGKFGEFLSCASYPNCNGQRKKPAGKKCPECGRDLFKTYFANPPNQGEVFCCTGYPDCKHVEKAE